MVDKNTDFFKIKDHFKETENIPSIQIYKNGQEHTPLFSIIIPTYKRVKYLREALESALNQETNIQYEVIVIDNNPERNDETELFMKSYSSNPLLSYYKNSENLGMVGNWNRGIQLTKSDNIVLLHDDDYISASFLAYCSETVKLFPDYGIIQTSKAKFNQKVDIISKPHKKDFVLFKLPNYYIGHSLEAPSGIVYRKEKIISVGGFNKDYYPSFDYCFHTLMTSRFKVIKTRKLLTYYRLEVNASMNPDTVIGFITVDAFLIRFLLKRIKVPSHIIELYVAARAEDYAKRAKLLSGKDISIPYKRVELRNYLSPKVTRITMRFAKKMYSVYIKLSKIFCRI